MVSFIVATHNTWLIMPRRKSDYGTEEIRKRRRTRQELTGIGHAYRHRVVDGDKIDSLLLKKKITIEQYEILQRFQRLLFESGMHGVRASSMEPRITGGNPSNMSDKCAESRVELRRLITFLNTEIGRNVTRTLVDMCLDMPYTESGSNELEIVCAALKKFYG